MLGFYEYEMNSGVQPDLELNVQRAISVPKDVGKSLELKCNATKGKCRNSVLCGKEVLVAVFVGHCVIG